MKYSVLILLVVLFSCNNQPSKRTKDLNEAAAMTKEEVALVGRYGVDDGRARMVLKYGEAKMKWYDSINYATHNSLSQIDSITNHKIDSVKNLNK